MPYRHRVVSEMLLQVMTLGIGGVLWTACAPQTHDVSSHATPTFTATSESIITVEFLPTLESIDTATVEAEPEILQEEEEANTDPEQLALDDVERLSEEFSEWFEFEGPTELVAINKLVAGQYVEEGLVALVNGRGRVIAVRVDAEWIANVPRLSQESIDFHTSDELGQARKELAQRGYGFDMQVASAGQGKGGILGMPQEGGVLVNDPWGNLIELPRPDETRVEVRWLGREWVGGYGDSQAGEWEPAVPFLVEGNEPMLEGDIMLTADDCSDPEMMRELLDLADSMGIKLTLFPNTPYIGMDPDLWTEILNGGHEIGYHTSNHSNGEWSEQWLDQDFNNFQMVIREATGVSAYSPRLVRPPFGLWEHGGWQSWVASRGLTTAMWGRHAWEEGWQRAAVEYLEDEGSLIFLLHVDPFDLWWLDYNRDFFLDLSPPYNYRTLSESLLKNGVIVQLEGLPGDVTNHEQ